MPFLPKHVLRPGYGPKKVQKMAVLHGMVSRESYFATNAGLKAIRYRMDYVARKANSEFFTESEQLDAMILPLIYSRHKAYPEQHSTVVMGASPPLGFPQSFDWSCVGCGTYDAPFF
jgi:hypothetical protein